MKFGVNLLNFGPGATPLNIERWARFAEDTGFDAVMISDHVAVTPDVSGSYPAPFYDPFIVLAWLAGFTKRIELGTTVTILPYRHPLHTSRLVSNIDQLCGGRFIFGVGAGWARQEFAALGIPFDKRGAFSNEYLDVLKRSWTHDRLSFHGRFVTFDDVDTGPRPLRHPHPPIWVGGASDAALRRAIRFGDAWHPIRIRIPSLRENWRRLQEMAHASGDRIPSLCPRIMLHLSDSPLAEDQRIAGTGTLEQVHRDLEALQELGAEHVLFDTYAGKPESTADLEKHLESYRRLAEQVVDLNAGSLR